jgi:signal transduction histidine kinase
MEALQIETNQTHEYVSQATSVSVADKAFIHGKLASILSFAKDIVENGNVAVTVLNDLINYDKIESNSMTIQQALLDPYHLVEKTLSSLQIQAKQADITLTLRTNAVPDVNTSNLVVFGDRMKLGQVIRNVVSNAIKFSPKGSSILVTGIFVIICM